MESDKILEQQEEPIVAPFFELGVAIIDFGVLLQDPNATLADIVRAAHRCGLSIGFVSK